MANHDDLSIYCRISAGAAQPITVSLEQQFVASGSWVAADVLTVRSPSGVPGAVGGQTVLATADETFILDVENLNCYAYRLAITLAEASAATSEITGRRVRRG
jgi:hypothetical protein